MENITDFFSVARPTDIDTMVLALENPAVATSSSSSVIGHVAEAMKAIQPDTFTNLIAAINAVCWEMKNPAYQQVVLNFVHDIILESFKGSNVKALCETAKLFTTVNNSGVVAQYAKLLQPSFSDPVKKEAVRKMLGIAKHYAKIREDLAQSNSDLMKAIQEIQAPVAPVPPPPPPPPAPTDEKHEKKEKKKEKKEKEKEKKDDKPAEEPSEKKADSPKEEKEEKKESPIAQVLTILKRRNKPPPGGVKLVTDKAIVDGRVLTDEEATAEKEKPVSTSPLPVPSKNSPTNGKLVPLTHEDVDWADEELRKEADENNRISELEANGLEADPDGGEAFKKVTRKQKKQAQKPVATAAAEEAE